MGTPLASLLASAFVPLPSPKAWSPRPPWVTPLLCVLAPLQATSPSKEPLGQREAGGKEPLWAERA